MRMEDDNRLSGAMQENVLVLLVFDEKHAKIARGSLTVQHFESSVIREVAGIALDFLDQFGRPVGDHLPDHLEHILKGDDERKANSYRALLENLFGAREGLNGAYVLSQLHKFVRQQTIKSAVRKVVECMEDGRIDDAEVEMQKGLNSGAVSFEPGIDLANPDQALTFLDDSEKPFLMGVAALDRYGVGPARKTLFMLNGAMGKGKSWGLGHIGKFALLQRLNVVHLTLEMSAEKTVQRYLQSMFSISKSESNVKVSRFNKTFDGSFQSIEFDTLQPVTLHDPNIRAILKSRIERRLAKRAAFKVKKFASGQLTMPALRAYLDSLERFEGLMPDMLIIDYAELMQLGTGDSKRGSIGQLFVDLRGLADERNMAVVTASQVNRVGIGKMVSDETDLAEDISKGFTVDTMVTFNQTDMEYKAGLARLFVAKNRDGEGRMSALITQSYAMGQFCLDSVPITDRYLSSLRPVANQDEEDEAPQRKRRAVK